MIFNSDLGKGSTLKQARLSKGWSQFELGKRANLSADFISKFERGERSPWPKARRSLAIALEVDIDDLFAG